jgi:shikimate 5-dehydrogenase
LTPVTHPDLPNAAAPGQLTVEEILHQKQLLGLLPRQSKTFVLFGSPISHSPSPDLHNAGFQHLKLPFQYVKKETAILQDVKTAIQELGSNFGGGSVTIPLKEDVLELLDFVDDTAAKIGAVNTIISVPTTNKQSKLVDGLMLYGFNTDWIGLYNPLSRMLPLVPPHCAKPGFHCAVVVGSGGTARAAICALQNLGYSSNAIIVYNPRNYKRADKLALEFNCLSYMSAAQFYSNSHSSFHQIDKQNTTSSHNLGFNIDDSNSASAPFTLKCLQHIVQSANSLAKQEQRILQQLNDFSSVYLDIVISTLPAASEFTLPYEVLANRYDVPFLSSNSSTQSTYPTLSTEFSSATNDFVSHSNSQAYQTESFPLIVFEVVYVPQDTKLVECVHDYCSSSKQSNCTIIRGAEMFLEQGFRQFDIWTNRLHASKYHMKSILEKKGLL